MPTSSLKAIKPTEFDYWKAQHLLNRAGFGGTPSQARALARMGVDEAVDYVVDFDEVSSQTEDTSEFRSDIMRPPTAEERAIARAARQNNDELALERLQRERNQRQATDREQMRAIQRWWLKRMIETGRPLEEKMTLFFHGHFATGYRTIEDSWHMLLQNQLFRRYAVGNFGDLCAAIIRDPAMLKYLDNDENRRASPNENLARELMELFVLGEGQGYSERDIKEGARSLTGYTFDDDQFVFRPGQHDDRPKTILGQTGRFNGDDFLRILLARPVASEFLCWKLYRFFVNDSHPVAVAGGDVDKDVQGFVRNLAKLLRSSDYDLRPVLKALFRSEHFHDPANMAALIKSPVQLVVQSIRSLRTPVRSLSALLSACDLMGQDLFFPPNVKGWDGGRAWINTATFFVRQNVVVYLLTGRRPDQYSWEENSDVYDATHLVEHLAESSGGRPSTPETVAYLLRFMLGAEPRPERIERIVEFVNQTGGTFDNDRLVATLSLIGAMPEHQLC
jgi:uncharacterized protein (DUF1800 family)